MIVWFGRLVAVTPLIATLSLLATTVTAWAVDEIFLTTGARITGDLQDDSLTLRAPHTSYRISRDTVWRIVLGGGGTGDTAELRNGNRLSGVVEQARYTLRLASGEVRSFERREIDLITLGGTGGASSPGLPDVLLLADGRHVYGDVAGAGFDIVLPSGTQRFARESVWQIVLGGAAGDTLDLASGDRLSGVVSEATYSIRTPDGQVLTFGRHEVAEVVLGRRASPGPGVPGGAPQPSGAGPAGVGPAAPGPAGPGPAGPGPAPGPAPPAGGPSVAAVPPAALPAPIRSVLGDVHFAFDQANLTAEVRRQLDELAAALKGFPALSLLIEGHADERGTAEYNLALGARRAEAVRAYLVGLGIARTRLDVIAYGNERPLDPEHNETAWALNRRAHFVVRSR